MGMGIESMVNRIKMPFVIAGASAYLILNLLGSIGCTKPTTPTPNNEPKPSANQTYNPTPTQEPTKTPTPAIVTPAPLETVIYETLISRVPEIKQFDARVANAAVAQIKEDIYSNKLDTAEVKIGDKTYNAWDYISKAIGFVLPQLKTADLSKYSDMDLRQILLPPQLRTIDIKRVIAERGINYIIGNGLEIALKNVTADDSLGGKSPQEWLREEVMKDYNDKNSRGYGLAIADSISAIRIVSWPNSTNSFLKIREDMLAKGEIEPLFIIGWSAYKIGEQKSNQLAPLVSRLMEPEPLASYPCRANYPTGTAVHTEPWISYKGKLIGAWMVEEMFLKDYEKSTWPDFKGNISQPNISLRGPDGKAYNPYTLKLIPK